MLDSVGIGKGGLGGGFAWPLWMQAIANTEYPRERPLSGSTKSDGERRTAIAGVRSCGVDQETLARREMTGIGLGGGHGKLARSHWSPGVPVVQ